MSFGFVHGITDPWKCLSKTRSSASPESGWQEKFPDVVMDLLFASSGIENEVVASADHLGILPKLMVPMATTAHLIALKVLAGRSQDLADSAASSQQRYLPISTPDVKR